MRKRKKWLWLSAFLVPLMLAFILLRSWNFDIEEYPAADTSPYMLPIKPNSTTFCIQGNKTICTHKEKFKYSFDFLLMPGTEIYAARDGVVSEILESVKGIGFFKGNFVAISSSDGTTAIYAHLRYDGAAVNAGDTIKQGQLIGYSGCTGQSIYPHLHFHVERDGHGVPASFNNLGKDDGVPRFLHFYTAK